MRPKSPMARCIRNSPKMSFRSLFKGLMTCCWGDKLSTRRNTVESLKKTTSHSQTLNDPLSIPWAILSLSTNKCFNWHKIYLDSRRTQIKFRKDMGQNSECKKRAVFKKVKNPKEINCKLNKARRSRPR